MKSAFIKSILTMKSALLFSSLLVVLHGHTLRAETAAGKDVEWVMTLGCRHCHFAEQTGLTTCKGTCGPAAVKVGKVFMLSGTAIPRNFKKSGKWLVKGAVSPDGKTIAVKEMTAQIPTPAELKNDQPAHAVPSAKPHTGPVAHSGQGLPTLTTADKILYTMKPSRTASTFTEYTLTRIGGGELTGTFIATGVTYEDDSHKWIVVESIRAADAQ